MAHSILIVDDEFGLADLLAELLREKGLEVTIAVNGALALELLSAGSFDLVLLDVMMPVLDGPTTLQRIRANPAHVRTPVVMMSALPEAVRSMDPSQYQAVLIKPFSFDALMKHVSALLEKSGG